MEFTKQDFTLLRSDLSEALKPLGEKYDIDFTLGNNISCRDLTFSFKLSGAKRTKDGQSVDVAKEEFIKHCGQYDLKPEDYHAECHIRGEQEQTYRIVGINPKARKNCIIVERKSDGMRYAYPRYFVVTGKESAPTWQVVE